MRNPSTPYITDQLIPYIGNKRKLLSLIHEAVLVTGVRGGTFYDAFAGSGVISRLAKVMGYRVISNDWEPYARVLNEAYIATNTPPPFSQLGGLDASIAFLNALPGEKGYIATHYCPSNDESYDVTKERMFFTQQNGRRIDAIREQIETWWREGKIDTREKNLLLAPLIYQTSYTSNTSGVFKGFHKGWGGTTRTAWYRIRSLLWLRSPILYDNGRENVVFCEDAAKLSPYVECDIAYLDPPYNQHQYGANYHLLNTVALWDKPEISPTISSHTRDKAAIRTDWRTLRRSPYCSRATALKAFEELVDGLRARWILVSYSTDGIIGLEHLLSLLAHKGELKVLVRRYKRYRVSSTRPSPRPHTNEFVAIINTEAAPRRDSVARAIEEIRAGGERSLVL